MALDKINVLLLTTQETKGVEFKAHTQYYPNWMDVVMDIGYTKVYSDNEASLELKRNFHNVIISVGKEEDVYKRYPNIFNAPTYIRKKWLNFEELPDPETLGRIVCDCYSNHFMSINHKDHVCSIITPIYHTKQSDFERAYNSLKTQSYNNWEWILVDDSKHKTKTKYIEELTKYDFRVKYYPFENSGVIGEVKRKGFMLATGDYLVELDHDDELTTDCLDLVVRTYKSDPEIGFVYSDCYQPHINKNGNITGSTNYGDYWGWGYGSQVLEEYKKMKLWRVITPNQNPKTLRFITAMPNHVRTWRKDVYYKIGGHNVNLPISDDYELCVRTFLETRMAKIPKALYLQYHYYGEDVPNTHLARNMEIQRTTWLISRYYDKAIHNRLVELGVDDYLWNEEGGYSEGLASGNHDLRDEHTTIIVDLEKI